MLKAGPARKVTIHLNEDTSSRKDFLYNEIFAFLFEGNVAGATMIRPEAGFGSHHRVHMASSGTHEHLPVRIEFVESASKVDEILPALCELISDGLIEVQETTIYKSIAGRESF
jgi:PII-like signaling protein